MRNVVYVNNENPNKFIEVRYYADGHQSIVQFQMTNTGNRNYILGKCYRMRVKKSSLSYLLNYYTEIKEA